MELRHVRSFEALQTARTSSVVSGRGVIVGRAAHGTEGIWPGAAVVTIATLVPLRASSETACETTGTVVIGGDA